jgi:hypothetical protein
LEIGPFHFTFIRLVMAVGIARVVVRREWLSKGINSLDWLVVASAFWALLSGFFHKDPSAALVYRLGFLYNTCGIYFLLRIFCQNLDDVVHLCRVTAILLIPVALEMIFEKVAVYNLFSALGGVDRVPDIRMGRIRANGPFAHAILAGTVGAVCMPLMIGLWAQNRKYAMTGAAACLTMIVACASSGPILSGLAAVMALFLWPLRGRMRIVRWLAVLGYIALDLVMKAPAYYLIGRIDVAGGSAGWHRARLIETAIYHISEWWFAGTDYTRHWMPTGVSWSPDHTDITNHYLQMGVIGGLPLTLLFIAVLSVAFSFVGRRLKQSDLPVEQQFFIWSIGASLFAHAATCISVSYFDQSFVFLYLTLAAIGSLATVKVAAAQPRRRRPLVRGIRRKSAEIEPQGSEGQEIPGVQPAPVLTRFGLKPRPKAVGARRPARRL